MIVTAKAGVVDALGSDDLICVTGPGSNSNLLSVHADERAQTSNGDWTAGADTEKDTIDASTSPATPATSRST